MKKQILMKIRYDGTSFHGWQIQPSLPTIQGSINEALSIICKEKIHVQGAGRTDAGVHAYGQQASFVADFQIPVDKIIFPLNNLLDDAIQVVSLEEVEIEFHPRFDAKAKKYIYKIKNSLVPDPFERNFYYHIKEKLDINLMVKASSYLLGTKDFKSFQASGGEEKETTVRTIKTLDIRKDKEELVIEIVGDGFLYNMVRIITGTLIQVGLGRIQPEKLEEIIVSCDREQAGPTAPAHGLYLAEVYY